MQAQVRTGAPPGVRGSPGRDASQLYWWTWACARRARLVCVGRTTGREGQTGVALTVQCSTSEAPHRDRGSQPRGATSDVPSAPRLCPGSAGGRYLARLLNLIFTLNTELQSLPPILHNRAPSLSPGCSPPARVLMFS